MNISSLEKRSALCRKFFRQNQSISKRECFNLIINSQKASGQFVDVELFIKELQSFDYKGIDKIIIQTFFIIELLQEQFKEFKVEWKLLVKKAQQWLNQQSVTIDEEMKQNIIDDFNLISGQQKAAILMLSLDEQRSASLFSLMDDEEIKELSVIMASLGKINSNVVEQLFEEFYNNGK